MTDPYQCLRCSSITIGVYNIIFCLTQFAVLGWQTQVVKELQWAFENRQVPPSFTMSDGIQARFPGLYALYTETPERRRINAMFVIVLIALGLCFFHLITTPLMIYGVIKRNASFICPWFFTGFPFIMLTTAYAILWWSGDVFNEQLTMSVAEFVLSLAINGPCFIVVLMYYLRISGRLRSDKYSAGRRGSQIYNENRPPTDVPPWHTNRPDQPPYEIGRKLKRRDRSRSPKRYNYEQSFVSAANSMPATSAEFARIVQQQSYRRPPTRQQVSSRPASNKKWPNQQPIQQPILQQSRPYSSQQPYRPTSVLKNNRSRSTTPAGMRRKSPQRVSFKNRPKVYERTPESSLSGAGRLEIQTVV